MQLKNRDRNNKCNPFKQTTIMKTFIIAIISAFIINANAFAGNDNKGFDKKQFAQQRTEQMTNRYGLSKKQAREVYEINEKLGQIIADNTPAAAHSTNKQTLRNQQPGMLQKATVAYDLALQKILNFQQYNDYLADKAAHQNHGPQAHHRASLAHNHFAHAPRISVKRH